MLTLVTAPSPKLQNRVLIVPVEVSVKVTTNGATPLVTSAEKAAAGTTAPLPVTGLVADPPLAVVTTTGLVNPPTVTGANCTVTLVEPPTGTVKVAPVRMLYGAPTVAVPLVTGVPPLLETTKTSCELPPVASVPKSKAPGLMAIWPAVTPTPVT